MKIPCHSCDLSIAKREARYGLHPKCFLQSFGLTSLEKFQDIAARHPHETEPLCMAKNDSTFFHGKFRKYSASLGEKRYILKIMEPEYTELPAIEYLCNRIFKSLGINVPPFYFILFEQGYDAFVTENFMASRQESSLVHLYHFFTETTLYNCESIIQIIADKTGRLTAQEDFVYLTLADSLIGNNDRHGRNLALIQSIRGFSLAPFYDNVSYLGIELDSLLGADHQPKGAIKTAHSDEPSMQDYVREWQRLGFDYVIKQFKQAVSLDSIKSMVAGSNLSEKRQQAFFRIISKRYTDLWG